MRSIVFAPIVILMVVLQSGCNDQDEAKKAPAPKKAIQGPVNGEPPINQVNFLPDVPGDQPKVLTNSIDMKLVLIPKGTFMMGSPPDEKGSEDNERRHEVTISRDYHLGMHEVTQAQYKKIMGKNPSHFQGDAVAERHPETNRVVKEVDSANHPVEQVSWSDAVEFCQRLSELPEEKKAGRVYRLPTEAEWEYACRAGSQTAYGFGGDRRILGDYGWHKSKSNANSTTHAVGLKKANAWGLYDMHGNVNEWCSDVYGDYPNGSVTDPSGPEDGSDCVCRGGSWNDSNISCGAARRFKSPMDRHISFVGFRLALSLEMNLLSEAPAKQTKVLTNSIGMKLVLIPKGTFMMGSPPDEVSSKENERLHEVTISRDYYLGMHEVTQAQYKKIMGKNPSHFQGDAVAERHPETNRVVKEVDSVNHPVEHVSWSDAVAFCQRLSALPEEIKAGRVYRLPTEAEWEYACRAGSQKAYSFSGDSRILGNYGWYKFNSNETTHPVGLKKANAWGLYDMHGNVWEWCADWYGEYPSGTSNDPSGPKDGFTRVYRGGCDSAGAVSCRCAKRNSQGSHLHNIGLLSQGFRVALSLSGISK